MKNKNRKNEKKEEIKEEVNVTSLSDADQANFERYPYVKRMLATLDKFLDKRIAGIALFYFLALAIIGIGLFANGQVMHAASQNGGSGGSGDLNVWLYSLLGILTFMIILVVTRVLAIRINKKKNN